MVSPNISGMTEIGRSADALPSAQREIPPLSAQKPAPITLVQRAKVSVAHETIGLGENTRKRSDRDDFVACHFGQEGGGDAFVAEETRRWRRTFRRSF